MYKAYYKKPKTIIFIFCAILLCLAIGLVPTFIKLSKQNQINNEVKQFFSLEQIKDSQGLQTLIEINSDFACWLKIDDVEISLPVVFSNNQSDDFYLSHNFEKKSSMVGVPYFTKNSTFESDNIVIVGHSEFFGNDDKNNIIFGNLKNYTKNNSNYNNQICFECLQKNITFTVICAFAFDQSKYNSASKIFNTNDISTQNEMQEFCQNVSSLAQKNDLQFNLGDKFVTLYTCDKDNQNQRIMVIAKQNI